MCFDATQLSVATLTMAFTTDDPRVQCVFNIYLFEYSTYKDIHQVHRHSRACNQIVSAFYGQKAFLTQRFRYNGNSHIRLIRPIMLLSRQRLIIRQRKNTEEVQQFLPFQRKNGLHFCHDLHTNLSKLQLFPRDLRWKIFSTVQMEIAWKFRMTICKWSWESRTYVIDKVGGFSPFLCFFLLLFWLLHRFSLLAVTGCTTAVFVLSFNFTSRLK